MSSYNAAPDCAEKARRDWDRLADDDLARMERASPQFRATPVRFTDTRESNPDHRKGDVNEAPRPLPELPAPMPFDSDLLPESLRGWIDDTADRLQCPPDLLAVLAVAGAGAIIGKKVAIRPQAKTDWAEVPNLWACVIARPGMMKSPAQSQALAPVRQLQAKARDEHAEALKKFAAEHQAWDLRDKAAKSAATKALKRDLGAPIDLPPAPIEPTLRRYIANDSNIASLGELCRQNYMYGSAILVERDELVGLLRGLEQEDRAEERAFYLQGWNGRDSYTFDRIQRGLDLHIPSVTLSVVGGAQPGRIAEYLRHAVKGTNGDDGLMQRFSLLVWPEQSGEWRNVDRWPDSVVKARAYAAFERLNSITPDHVGAERDQFDSLPYLRFSPGGLAVFEEWRFALELRLHGDSLHPAMASHLAKYRKAIPALALIFHLIEGGIGPVSETAAIRAAAWSEYLESHANRAYASVTNSITIAARAVLRRLPELPAEFTAREIYRRSWAGLGDAGVVGDALEMLVDHRYLIGEQLETGGRRTVIYTPRAQS